MKKVVILLSIIFLLLLSYKLLSFTDKSYEVIEVVEGDLIYIDLNRNKISDKNELFHLSGVNSFPLKLNNKTKIYMDKFGLSLEEVFMLGNLGIEFTKNNLLNKEVKFIEKPKEYDPDYKYRFGKISRNKEDWGITLLKNGLGAAYWGKEGIPYLSFENKEKVKENIAKIINADNKISEKVKNNNISEEKYKEIIKIENLSLYLSNPNKYKKPQNACVTPSCKNLLSEIQNAEETIDIAIYGIENENEILNALKTAKDRGVKIRCAADSDANGEFTYADTKELEKVCESVKYDNKYNIMHNKFFIFDNKKVITGSTNMSPTGIGGYNSNSIVVIENKDISSTYKKEFDEMFKGLFQIKKENNNSRRNIKINNDTYVDVFFSPKGDMYKNLFHPLITNAKSLIYIDVFYLTHKEIAQDLINAHKRGVEIKIIIDATSAKNPKSRLKELRNEGIKVKVENWGGKAHEKTMSIDNKILILGSANFTQSAMNYNDENTIAIYNSYVTKEYNKFFIALYNSIDDKYLLKIPNAEGFASKNSCYDGIDNDFDGKKDKEDSGCINR